MVANFWLRSGNSSSSNNFLSFLEDTLAMFGDKKVGLVRLDSGFCSDQIMSYLESTNRNYIVAARFTHPIQRLIGSQDSWIGVDEGIQICDKAYQGGDWKSPRRIVIVRQRIEERRKLPVNNSACLQKTKYTGTIGIRPILPISNTPLAKCGGRIGPEQMPKTGSKN